MARPPKLPHFYAMVAVTMALPALACLLLVLYGSATGVNDWLYSGSSEILIVPGNWTARPIEVSFPGNGRLGISTFCPNTGPAVALNTFLRDGSIPQEVPPSPCYAVEWDCEVTICNFGDSVFINTTSEQVGVCGVYNMFNPLPLYENDTVHKILDLFPGGGSCAAYNSVRVFHWVAFSCSVVGALLGLHLILLYFIRAQAILTIYLKVMSLVYIVAAGCALIAISVWDGSIAKPSNRGSSSLVPTNYLGHGFWLEVSSLIFSAIVSLAAAVLSETARAAPPPPGAGGFWS
eukprot:jgi/Tetstr1/438024/TSEL_026651.t1